MKILHVVHGLPYGGLDNGLVNLANSLPQSNFEQTICCFDRRGEIAYRVSENVPIFVLGRCHHDLALPFRLMQLIKNWQPDLVYCRNWNTWLDSYIAGSFASGPHRLTWSFHGFGNGGGFPLRRNIASNFLAKGTGRLVAVCKLSAELFATKTGALRRFDILYNGVDTLRFALPIDQSARKKS